MAAALLAAPAMRVKAAESYFGSTAPSGVPAAVDQKHAPALAGAAGQLDQPEAPVTLPALQNAAPAPTGRTPEEIKLDEALGTPGGFSEELEQRFRRALSAGLLPTGGNHPTYQQELDRVRTLLGERKTTEAWLALQDTAKLYDPVDAHACGELAAWVKSGLDLDKSLGQLDTRAEQTRTAEIHAVGLTTLLKKSTSSVAPIKPAPPAVGKPAPLTVAKPGAPTAKPAAPAPTPPPPPDWVVITDQKELEEKLELKLKELEAAEARQGLDKAKDQIKENLTRADREFTAFVQQLCTEGKFEQAALARPFYEQVFHANCAPAAAGLIAEAETRSREVNARLQLALAKWKMHRVAAATEDLRQAFANGACQPSLVDLDGSERNAVRAFIGSVDSIRQAVKRHEFNGVAGELDAIHQSAPDFDPAKLLALVHTNQLESGFYVDGANQAWQAKQLETARERWWRAKKAWSDNPVLNNFPEVVRTTWDAQQRTAEFDQLVAAKGYRQLADQRQLFTDQLTGDTARLEQLQKIAESVELLDLALGKIENTRRAGDVDGAWELAEDARKGWPDDPRAQTWFARLSTEGANYVQAIQQARDAEARGQYGYSLNWYVAALQIYPGSQRAKEASLHLRDLIFPPGERRTFVLASAHEGS